jgi:hypothetical protein
MKYVPGVYFLVRQVTTDSVYYDDTVKKKAYSVQPTGIVGVV